MKPPINSTVKIIRTIVPSDPRLGQTGTVIQYSGHGMICVHFPDIREGVGIFFNPSDVQVI